MSTRSQIQFKDNYNTAQIYRHSDGYPDSEVGVIADLKELKDCLERTSSFRDASYLAAQFIFREKLKHTRIYQDGKYTSDGKPIVTVEDVLNTDTNQPNFLLGHGVEDPSSGIHGDEEYLYVVEVGEGKKWHIKVSGHRSFPTWEDENREKAFEMAKWQFEGTLDQAYKKYVK